MNIPAQWLHRLWHWANGPHDRAFRRALNVPGTVQSDWLRKCLRRESNTAYGKAHGFSGIRSREEYAERVPFMDAGQLDYWVKRLQSGQGEEAVLTTERVSRLMPTSGTSGGRKLIPFNRALSQDWNRGVAPWLCDLRRQDPGLFRGGMYWSISPVLQPKVEAEPSRLPVGFDSDASYLGGARRWMAQWVMAVPDIVRLAPTLESFQYAALLALLRRADLTLISVWHPSFLTLLLDALRCHWESLLKDIEAGTCAYAEAFPPLCRRYLRSRPMPRRAASLGRADGRELRSMWPGLGLISCWGDGPSALAMAALRERCPGIPIQPKGLMATEALVTIPFGSEPQHPLAVRSHYFEFLEESGRVRWAEELQLDEVYEVVVTTRGGLYRYRLGDRVRVKGWVGKTPSLEFVGRGDMISDLRGEKLSQAFVETGFRSILAGASKWPRFLMLAPEESGSACRYVVFVEGVWAEGSTERLEDYLRDNPNYDYCRRLGQLGALQTHRIGRGGYEIYLRRMTEKGAAIGDIKPCGLSRRTDWRKHFSGETLDG